MARVEAAKAVNSVWTRTLASYKKELPPKDLSVVEGITSPTDLAGHIENLEAKRHAGKRGAFADQIHSITGRLTKFSSLIDILTSSNTEASLIWGSLKLLLTIVHRSAEEYEKICQSILAVSHSFPTVDLVATTFDHSELVCSYVVAFYESVLLFWSKALIFYKRRRVFNIFRAWHDFDSEFGALDRDMKRHGKAIEKAAAAVHMNESRAARLEQIAVNRQLIEATRSTVTSERHRDIVQWLAPFNHEASYFADDLRSAYESRHPGTCTWILERPEFDAWMNSEPNDAATRMLWLTGVPGAGKTVLSSFVINRCSEVSGKKPSTPTLYFFFKMTDSDKNSALAVTRSLVYQLYSLFPASVCGDIVSLRDDSGKDKALSDQRLWDLFVKHAKKLANLTIVLDALDECDGVDVLLGRIIALSQCCRARIFVVSRKEENIALAMEEYPHIIITHKYIEADIHSYVTAEIGKIPRFRGKPVQQRMISALSSGHGGMFLWAYLMIKELKELGTVRQVDDALRSLPKGLGEMHEMIITRLDATLRSAHRQLAIRILMWIVCAVRPLRLVELQEIMRFEFREGGTPVDDDDLFYSEKDIELACGALVLSRNGTLQLIHLSTREILLKNPSQMLSDDPRLDFYVDAQRENPHMATLCISYISTHLAGIDSLTRPNLMAVSRLQLTKESYDFTDLVRKSPFIDYASISWQAHLIDGEISLQLENIMRQLQGLLTYDLTILWIELCVSLHQDIIWTMERSCKETMSWADYASVPAESSCHEATAFLWAWSNAVLSIINEYGRVIEDYPYEIHYLDLENVLRYNSTPGSPVLPASYAATQSQALREQFSEIRTVDKHSTSVKVEPYRQLQLNVEDPTRNFTLGFVIYDSKREVYITAEVQVHNKTEVLWVQEQATGRRLQPIRGPLSDSDVSFHDLEASPSITEMRLDLMNAILSRDRKYLAILYADYIHTGDFITSIWVIEDSLDFHDIRHRRPWARRLHCFRTQSYFFVGSCLPLTVGQDGLFYCPTWQIHPERGIQKEIPSSMRNSTYPRENHTVLAFAGDGQTLIKLNRNNGLIEEISWLEDAVTQPWQFPMPASHAQQEGVYLRAISRTARFMVYETTLKDESSVVFYLFDRQGNLEQLQVNSSRPHNSTIFYFSQDEQYLLGIYPAGQGEPNKTHFSRWAVSKPSFIPQEETILLVPGFYPASSGTLALFPLGGTVCVAEEDSTIVLVTKDRVVYELDLQSLNFKEGTLAMTGGISFPFRPYCQREYRVSKNGCQIVGLYLRCPEWSDDTRCGREEEHSASLDLSQTRLELKRFNLSGTADQFQTVELEYLDPKSPAFHEHVITFSPDLSMVQAGPHVFDLLAPGYPPLSFPDSPLEKLRRGENSSISFSTCNCYLVIIEGKDDVAQDEPVTLALFRICRTVGKIEKISIAGLDDLVVDGFRAAFHPALPLLVLTCITRQEHDVRDAAGSIKVMEIDLEALKSAHIDIPKHELAIIEDDEKEYWRTISTTRAQFSDCGSFCFLNYFSDGVLILSSDLLKAKAAKMRTPAVWGYETSYNERFYQVGWRDESTMVNVYQATDRPGRHGLRDSTYVQYPPECTISVAITAIPIHLAPAAVYLLTGKHGDDLIRVLFMPEKGPPEIKDLRVTLNQILEKLAARSAEVRGFWERFEKASEGGSSDMESEEAVISADENRQGNLDSD